jgi:hypothetical protein
MRELGGCQSDGVGGQGVVGVSARFLCFPNSRYRICTLRAAAQVPDRNLSELVINSSDNQRITPARFPQSCRAASRLAGCFQILRGACLRC